MGAALSLISPPIVSYALPFDRVILTSASLFALHQFSREYPEFDRKVFWPQVQNLSRTNISQVEQNVSKSVGIYSLLAGGALAGTALLPIPQSLRSALITCIGCMSALIKSKLYQLQPSNRVEDYSSINHLPSLALTQLPLGLIWGISPRYAIYPYITFLAAEYVFTFGLKQIELPSRIVQ